MTALNHTGYGDWSDRFGGGVRGMVIPQKAEKKSHRVGPAGWALF